MPKHTDSGKGRADGSVEEGREVFGDEGIDGRGGGCGVRAPAARDKIAVLKIKLDHELVVNTEGAWELVAEIRAEGVYARGADADGRAGTHRGVVEIPDIGDDQGREQDAVISRELWACVQTIKNGLLQAIGRGAVAEFGPGVSADDDQEERIGIDRRVVAAGRFGGGRGRHEGSIGGGEQECPEFMDLCWIRSAMGHGAGQQWGMTQPKPQTTRSPEPVGAYPPARKVGNLLFISGQGPRQRGSKDIPGVTLDASGAMVDYEIEPQVRACFQNVRFILEEHGASWESIVDVTCFLTNIERDFAVYNRVYAELFPSGPQQPCRTTVGVSGLPRGGNAPIAFEVKVIAAVG